MNILQFSVTMFHKVNWLFFLNLIFITLGYTIICLLVDHYFQRKYEQGGEK